jgi:hypothetical protein
MNGSFVVVLLTLALTGGEVYGECCPRASSCLLVPEIVDDAGLVGSQASRDQNTISRDARCGVISDPGLIHGETQAAPTSECSPGGYPVVIRLI